MARLAGKLAIIVHGLFTKDISDSPLDELTPLLKQLGFDVYHFRYGFSGINRALENKETSLGLRWVLNSISTTVYKEVLLIGHSNGCAIIDMALRKSDISVPTSLIFLSPLVKSKTDVSRFVTRLDVFYNPLDIVSYIIHPLSLLPDFLTKSNWGGMAIKGCTWKANNVFNHKSHSKSLNPCVQHNPFLMDSNQYRYLYAHLKSLFSV